MVVKDLRVRDRRTVYPGRARRAAIRLGSVAALLMSAVLVGVVGTAGPAHAAGETDFVLINTSRIDFGLLINPLTQSFWEPGATVQWQPDPGNIAYDPRLFGVIEMKNASGYCGQMRMEAFDALESSLGSVRSNGLCSNISGPVYLGVELTLGQPIVRVRTYRVVVSAWLKLGQQGVYQQQMSATVYP